MPVKLSKIFYIICVSEYFLKNRVVLEMSNIVIKASKKSLKPKVTHEIKIFFPTVLEFMSQKKKNVKTSSPGIRARKIGYN